MIRGRSAPRRRRGSRARSRAVHLRHLDVHQHEVVPPELDGRERLDAVGRDVGRVAQRRAAPDASFWLTALSSARRMRSGEPRAASGRAPADRAGVRPVLHGPPRASTTAPCTRAGLSGVAAQPAGARRPRGATRGEADDLHAPHRRSRGRAVAPSIAAGSACRPARRRSASASTQVRAHLGGIGLAHLTPFARRAGDDSRRFRGVVVDDERARELVAASRRTPPRRHRLGRGAASIVTRTCCPRRHSWLSRPHRAAHQLDERR